MYDVIDGYDRLKNILMAQLNDYHFTPKDKGDINLNINSENNIKMKLKLLFKITKLLMLLLIFYYYYYYYQYYYSSIIIINISLLLGKNMVLVPQVSE